MLEHPTCTLADSPAVIRRLHQCAPSVDPLEKSSEWMCCILYKEAAGLGVVTWSEMKTYWPPLNDEKWAQLMKTSRLWEGAHHRSNTKQKRFINQTLGRGERGEGGGGGRMHCRQESSPGESRRRRSRGRESLLPFTGERTVTVVTCKRVNVSQPAMELLDSHVYSRGSGVGWGNTRLPNAFFLEWSLSPRAYADPLHGMDWARIPVNPHQSKRSLSMVVGVP
jgi:hypothetical protein